MGRRKSFLVESEKKMCCFQSISAVFFSFLFQTAGKTVELFLIESFIVVSMFWRLFQAAVCFPSIWNGFFKWSRLASSGAVSIIFKNRFQWYNFFQSSWIVAEWILYDERLGFVESTAMFLSVEFEFQEMFRWLHWKVQTSWSISETGNSFENSWTIFVSMIARVTSWVWNDLKKKLRLIAFGVELFQRFNHRWSNCFEVRFWLDFGYPSADRSQVGDVLELKNWTKIWFVPEGFALVVAGNFNCGWIFNARNWIFASNSIRIDCWHFCLALEQLTIHCRNGLNWIISVEIFNAGRFSRNWMKKIKKPARFPSLAWQRLIRFASLPS